MPRTNLKELPKVEQVSLPLLVLEGWDKKEIEPYLKKFSMGAIRILFGWSPKHGYHLVFSCKDRFPTWDEISVFRYLMLDEDKYIMVLMLPKMDEFMNSSDRAIHIWEMSQTENIKFVKPSDYKEVIHDLKIQLEVHRK